MNIAVINLKDLIRYMICFIAILIIVSLGMKKVFEQNKNYEIKEGILSKIQNSSFLYCLENEAAIFSSQEDTEEFEIKSMNLKEILNVELSMLPNLKENVEDKTSEENNTENQETDIKQDEEVKLPETNVETKVIDEKNLKESFNATLSDVKIKNETKLDISGLKPNYELKNKNKVIIYHTHTCESYTSSEKFNYKMTGVYRTTDLNFTVSRVGDELEKYLKEYGKQVIHSKTYHDYPAYNGSYGRSLTTLEGIMKDNKDAEVVIDLHRDAIGSGDTYGPTVKIGDDVCAQVMFVMGTNGSRTLSSKLETKFTICNESTRDCK